MNNYVLEDKTLVVTRFEKKSARLNHLKKEFEEKKKESYENFLCQSPLYDPTNPADIALPYF